SKIGICNTTANSAILAPSSGTYAIVPNASVPDDWQYPALPVRALKATAASYASANLSGSQASSAIYGARVSILAKYIDINGSITAGTPTDWSLSLPSTAFIVVTTRGAF